jgi:hypothetical protein
MRFENITTGDTVLVKDNIYYGSGWSRSCVAVYQEQTVTKVTATQFTTSTGKRFQRRAGAEVGGETFAYPLGYQETTFGREPKTLVATTEEDIGRINYAIKLANSMVNKVYALSKDSKAFYLAVKNPEMIAALKQLESAINTFNDIVNPKTE